MLAASATSMPDPFLYTQAFLDASVLAALLALLIEWTRPPASTYRISIACIVAIAVAHAVGYYVLQLRIAWPPASALDRWIIVLLPAVLIVELVACAPRVSQRTAMILRCGLAAMIGRVLLHGSIYLQASHAGHTYATFVLCAVLTAAIWLLLIKLQERAPSISLPLALALTIQSAGVAIMLAGYLKGGAAAIIATAALLGATLASLRPPSPSLIGVGVVSLASLLTIGVYFGRLPPLSAVALAGAPLLCWTTELPWLKQQRPWIVASLRLALVALVAAIVLMIAKRKFDIEMAPLL